MIKWLLVVAVLAPVAVARAGDRLPPIINVTSVTASSTTTDAGKVWQVIQRLGAGEDWCVDTSKGGVGESLTITFDPPAAVDGVTIEAPNSASPITAMDVIADGRSQRVTKRGTNLDASLKGAPISKLVLKVAAFDKGPARAACVSQVQLQAAREPGVIYKVSAKEAAALEPRVRAIRAGLQSCTKLGDLLAFPFEYAWTTLTRDGMQGHGDSYANAAKATAACRRRKFARIVKAMQFAPTTVVSADDAGKVTIQDVEPWRLQLRDGTWVLVGVGDTI